MEEFGRNTSNSDASNYVAESFLDTGKHDGSLRFVTSKLCVSLLDITQRCHQLFTRNGLLILQQIPKRKERNKLPKLVWLTVFCATFHRKQAPKLKPL